MKPAPILLLFFFLSTLTPSSAAAAGEAVRDKDGRELLVGAEYHIMPSVLWYGGLTLASRDNKTTCQLDVAQEGSELENGIPVTFFPADPREKIVRLSADSNVEFSRGINNTCPQYSPVWKLRDAADEATGRVYVGTGGVTGNPGCETVRNWFKIRRYSRSRYYELVFCPSVCGGSKCGELATFKEGDGGGIWLAMTMSGEKPTSFYFKTSERV